MLSCNVNYYTRSFHEASKILYWCRYFVEVSRSKGVVLYYFSKPAWLTIHDVSRPCRILFSFSKLGTYKHCTTLGSTLWLHPQCYYSVVCRECSCYCFLTSPRRALRVTSRHTYENVTCRRQKGTAMRAPVTKF